MNIIVQQSIKVIVHLHKLMWCSLAPNTVFYGLKHTHHILSCRSLTAFNYYFILKSRFLKYLRVEDLMHDKGSS